MNDRRDLRRRGLHWLSAVTAAIGAASVAAAGAVGFALPGATHHRSSNRTAGATVRAATHSRSVVPAGLETLARRAVAGCPKLALLADSEKMRS
jgi:hypothetical protein